MQKIQPNKFSVIMPSYLGNYEGAADDRERKFYRAVRSVQQQQFKDFELVIISDGCELTQGIYQDYFSDDSRIRLVELHKQPLWSSVVRNAGLEVADGEWVCYLDTDDMFGADHLRVIHSQIAGHDSPIGWVYFNHYIAAQAGASQHGFQATEELVLIDVKGKCGTCNLAHRNQPEHRWNDNTYLHDWRFIELLKMHSLYTRIKTPEYYVCHFPNRVDA